MNNPYYGFFGRVEKIYGSANGFLTLSRIVSSKQIITSDMNSYKKLRGKLSETEYEIAATILFNFFKRHNGKDASDRILGISEEHKRDLTTECIEIEEDSNSFLQSA